MTKQRLSIKGLNPNRPLSDQLTVKNALEVMSSLWITTSYIVLPETWTSGAFGDLISIVVTAVGVAVVYTVISLVEYFFSEVELDTDLDEISELIEDKYRDHGHAGEDQ